MRILLSLLIDSSDNNPFRASHERAGDDIGRGVLDNSVRFTRSNGKEETYQSLSKSAPRWGDAEEHQKNEKATLKEIKE